MAHTAVDVVGDVSPEILANKGVIIYVHTTREWNERGVTKYQADTSSQYEIRLKFTNWQLHLLEDHFATLDNFLDVLQKRKWSTVMTVLKIVTEWPIERCAEAMMDKSIYIYQEAVANAFLLALGHDPKEVSESFTKVLELVKEEQTSKAKTANVPLETMGEFVGATSGTSGSD